MIMSAEEWQDLLIQIEENLYSEEKLDLRNQELTDADMPDLLKALAKNTNIRHLKLLGNHITDVGAAALAENETLLSLDLQYNRISDVGAMAIIEKNEILTSLELYGNTFVSDAVVDRGNRKTNLNALRLPSEKRFEFMVSFYSKHHRSTFFESEVCRDIFAIADIPVQKKRSVTKG